MRKNGYDLGDSLLVPRGLQACPRPLVVSWLGTWADRFGIKRTVALSYLVGAIGIAALTFKSSILLNYVFVAIAGFGTVSASLILTGFLAQRLDPTIRSAGTGFALSFSRIGALTGPLLGGFIASTNLAPEWNFYIFAAVAALAALATVLIPSSTRAS